MKCNFCKSTNGIHEKWTILKFCNQLFARILEKIFYKNICQSH